MEKTRQVEEALEKSRLRRAMGFWDLVLFYVAAVVGLRWIATASRVGPSAVVIWIFAFVFFFVPLASAVTELSSRYPEEGGIYVWSRKAFGDFHAFMTGWTYWTAAIVYFPGLLFFAASNAAYVVPRYAFLAENKLYLAVFSLAGLAVALAMNIVGLSVGKILHNASGSIGTWAPALILMVMGVIAWLKYGPANDFTLPNLHPHVGGWSDVAFWSSIAFAFGGMESASVMGEEVRDAGRNIPRALIVAGAMITFMYIVGTACLLLALPQESASGLNGIIDAIRVTGERVGIERVGITSLAALLFCIGNIGGVGAWIAATARLPFVAGIDRFLPAVFGRIHPRWGTPYVALLVQGAITALFIVLAELAGKTAEDAYSILVSLGIIVYFIPYLYLFLALIVLQREEAGPGVIRVPFGRPGAYVAGSVGFLVTASSIVLACIPDASVENRAVFFRTIFGTVAGTLVVGLLIYLTGMRRRARGAERKPE